VTSPDRVLVDRLTIRADLGPVRELVPIEGGSNNRVYRVECDGGRAVLKSYFRSPADPRDRLGAEFAFCRYAWETGVTALPRPLASDPATGLGLFEFVEGTRPQRASESLVGQAADFVRAVNLPEHRSKAASLPLASEACFTVEEHLGVVGGRANRLGDIEPEAAIDRDALRFVHCELMPVWRTIRDTARARSGADKPTARVALAGQARIVSPSDFGFHNALIRPDGRAVFLDFEYAGWDDPAKLICDFFCQPAIPVSLSYFEQFAAAVLKGRPDEAEVIDRARLLLPVYRVKWICIRLNEFLPGGGARRLFASQQQVEARKREQLASAREALGSTIGFERISA
jgi:phosphotransferase family enzyme